MIDDHHDLCARLTELWQIQGYRAHTRHSRRFFYSGTLRTEPYKETRRQRKFHRPLNDKPPLLELVPTLPCRILSRISLSTQLPPPFSQLHIDVVVWDLKRL